MKNPWVLSIAALSLVAAVFPTPAHSSTAESELSLDEFMKRAQADSPDLKAVELDIEALRSEITARNLDLGTRLRADLSAVNDRKESTSTQPRSTQQSAAVQVDRQFSTGTSLGARVGRDLLTYRGSPPAADSAAVDWEVSLSQELWRNSFGRGLGLRERADQEEFTGRWRQLIARRQGVLKNLEDIYWDLAETQGEIRISSENLRRSRQMASWVRERARRAAAEPIDLLQAEALVAQRELQLQTLENKMSSLRSRVEQLLPGMSGSSWRPDDKAVATSRSFEELLLPGGPAAGEVRSLDFLANQALTSSAELRAEQSMDATRPSLALNFAYGKNGIDPDPGTAFNEATSSNQDQSRIGLTFSMDLDRSLAKAPAQAARQRAEAEKLRLERARKESSEGWSDLVRELDSLGKRIETAKKLAQLHARKVTEERKRFERGRSTAFQAIAFEVDAAESMLQVHRLQATLRRTESKARLYTRAEQE